MPDLTFHPKQVQRIRVNATADGDNTVINTPGPGKAILVLNYEFTVIGAGDATIRSGAAGTIHYVITGVAAPGTHRDFDANPDVGAFLLDANSSLVINNAVGVDTVGHLAFRIISV